MYKIGITERGDAGIDFTWVNKLDKVVATILITKNLNDNFINKVIELHNQGHKFIIHITCTGYGGTILERNVPTKEWTHTQALKLIAMGFPVSQLVLRVDPIIPTLKGSKLALNVINLFKDTGIKRIRFSFLDMYKHVKTRFLQAGLTIPYNSFNAPEEMMNFFYSAIDCIEGFYFESCAENRYRKGCISEADFYILGLDINQIHGKSQQRSGCLCAGNKFELLENKCRCPHKCLYCFWRG